MEKRGELGGQGGRAMTAYEHWMEQEDIPVYRSIVGVHDVAELPKRPWARMGGSGSFVEMRGVMEEGNGIYVAEIPGGGALNPERHLYQEAIFIYRGRGLTEVWQEGGPKVTFEWGEGSVFAPPLNAWHRLVNGSREPALFLAVTTAPGLMSALSDSAFAFNCEHQFLDRFGGEADYFATGENRRREWHNLAWATNFIPDVRTAFLEAEGRKASGGLHLNYRMAGNFPVGHMSQWPVGRYHKAHYHGPGALLQGLRGDGYCLLWPHEFGTHPYRDGFEDQVVHQEWKAGSIYSPPNGWYHQHFNTSNEPARLLAMYGNHTYRQDAFHAYDGDEPLILTSVREGGSMVEYEDEDPEIRRRFEEVLRRGGVECTMPEQVYRS